MQYQQILLKKKKSSKYLQMILIRADGSMDCIHDVVSILQYKKTYELLRKLCPESSSLDT